MRYTQQDKARILRVTTRTLQNWRKSKPELYAIIEASFLLREKLNVENEISQQVQELIKQALPKQ
nr:hypothetical protein [Campylobacter suis]